MPSTPTLPDSIVNSDIQNVLSSCKNEFTQLAGRKILLTGGGGFVGSYLVESVAAFNRIGGQPPCQLFLPTRSPDTVKLKFPHLCGLPHISWFEWDSGWKIHTSGPVDYVIHAASPADPADYLDAPYEAMKSIAQLTQKVLDFSLGQGAKRFLYVSSGAVYGEQPAALANIPETYNGAPDLTNPASCYGESKRYCELLCRTSGIPAMFARLFSFVGPYQKLDGNFAIGNFIRQAVQHQRIQLYSPGLSRRTFCYASDLASALWKLLLNGECGEIYNVGRAGTVVTIREVADAVSQLIGDIPVSVPLQETHELIVRQKYIPDVSKLSSLYAPQIDWRDGIARTLASLYARGKIPHVSETVRNLI
ncbi:MAG: hypothetical protein A2143_10630 [Gallionellales bacterium RBG_16_57_15]|nr:MAG: hypothetical protein A2143_10630 [Gallionellales bacterium RBG_16_57_15]